MLIDVLIWGLDVKSWLLILGFFVVPPITWWAARRYKRAVTEKTEQEAEESRVEVQIKVDQYNDQKWEKMKNTNEKLSEELHEIRSQLYESEERHRQEFNKLHEKLRKAELRNLELTAELNLHKTVKS